MADDRVSAALAALRAIEQAATEGPWEMHSHAAGPSYATRVFDIWHDEQDAYIAQDCLTEADAAFTVTARTAVPRLVAAVEAGIAALARHQQTTTARDGTLLCAGCLDPAPCKDSGIIEQALLGKESRGR